MTDENPSARGRQSRRKGHAYERQVAAWFRAHGVEAHRTIQSRGGGKDGADVVVPGLHIECKAGAAPNVWAAMEQAQADSAPGLVPVVFAHRDQRRVGAGAVDLVVMRAEDALPLLARMARERA